VFLAGRKQVDYVSRGSQVNCSSQMQLISRFLFTKAYVYCFKAVSRLIRSSARDEHQVRGGGMWQCTWCVHVTYANEHKSGVFSQLYT